MTSPAIRHEKAEASNRVMGPIPLTPLRIASHVGSVPIPNGVTKPTPVTTTLRLKTSLSRNYVRLSLPSATQGQCAEGRSPTQSGFPGEKRGGYFFVVLPSI